MVVDLPNPHAAVWKPAADPLPVKMRLRICRQVPPDSWNKFLDTAAAGTPFQSRSWLQAWSETHGLRARYILAFAGDGDILAALPFLETRQRGGIYHYRQAMPMGCYGSVIARPDCAAGVVAAVLKEFLRLVNGWRCIGATLTDYAGNCLALAPSASGVQRQFTHILPLNRPLADIYRNYDCSLRKNVQNAERSQITVREARSLADIEAYCGMADEIAAKYNRQPYSRELFKNIYRLMVPAGEAWYTLASLDGQPVAGALHIMKCGYVYNWLSVSRRELQKFRAVEIINNSVIRRAVEQGSRCYDFGASPPEAEGLIRFKEKWGTERRDYVSYQFRGGSRIPSLIRRFKRVFPTAGLVFKC